MGKDKKILKQSYLRLEEENIRLLPKISYEELATSMIHADICLGVSGTTCKATIVIPNKVFEALAS